MKTYTEEDKTDAKGGLPATLAEFIDSPDLVKVFTDIKEAFQLNLRQTAAVIEVSTLTLLGLESETDFPLSARTALPELSKENLDGIVKHANDHIFTEAKRRLLESRKPSDTERGGV